MPQPNDYSSAFAPVEPSQAFMQGIQSGVGIQNLQVQQQQQQAALAAQQQRNDAFQRLASNPNRTADDWAQAMTLMPDMSEHFKRAWEVQNTAQQQATVGEMSQVAAALTLGKPEAAAAILTNRIKALENGGPPDQLQGAKSMLAMIQADPQFALGMTMAKLRANPAAKDVVENIVKLNKDAREELDAPIERRKKIADADAAEVDAGIKKKYGETSALLDIRKKGWDITAIVEDIGIKKEANRIAAMTAAAAREGNALKREELQLKIDETRKKIDEAAREKVAEAESRISGVVDARTLIREVKDLGFSLATGITAGSSLMPGSDARTVAGKISQLQNILTLDYLDKLKGATSDNDIKFLKGIASNLDRWQSTGKFGEELEKVDAALARVDVAVRKKYGMPPALKPSNPAPAAPQAPAGAAGAAAPTVSGW